VRLRELRRRPELWRGAVVFWCVFWVVVGVWTGYELWQLAELGSTLGDSGRALDSAGTALQSLGSVPLVGDDTAALGDEVRRNATDIVADAGRAQSSLRQVGVLVGLTIALMPTVPALVILALDDDQGTPEEADGEVGAAA
jgi:hypothetical protein